MSINAPKIIEKVIAANPSPYPVSFDGSTLRFQLALFSMMAISIMGFMTAAWMGRELWKGRHEAFPWEPLFAVRAIFFICAVQAVLRCAPEAAWMITYREGSVELVAQIMIIKRWLDAGSILPGLGWMMLVWGFYTPMGAQMVRISRQAPIAPRVSKGRLWRFGIALVLTFAISALIAVGKQ